MAANSGSRPRTSSGFCTSGQSLGLTFDDLGKRRHGTPSTLRFCDELFRLYGSDDYNEAMGAAFAVENWAAAGFWKELISGLEKMKAKEVPRCRSAFFTWHDKIEDLHKSHVWDELKDATSRPSSAKSRFNQCRREDARRREGLLGRPQEMRQRSGKFAA